MINRLVDFYRVQFGLLWKWRLGRTALIKRAVLSLIAAVIAFNITAWLLPGQLQIVQLGGGLIAVIFISLLNLLVRPLLLGLVASRSVVALLVLTLVWQAVTIWLLDPFVHGRQRLRRVPHRPPDLIRVRLHPGWHQPALRAR